MVQTQEARLAEEPRRRSPLEIQFPSDQDAEDRFFQPPSQAPGDISLMMMLPRPPFWRTRGFLYGVGGAVVLAGVVALLVWWLGRSGPGHWLVGRWEYAGDEGVAVALEVDRGEVATYIDGVWSFAAPYEIVAVGSSSLVLKIGGTESTVRFDGPDRLTIETGGEVHPYVRAPGS